MATSAKAQSMVRTLKERLALRMPSTYILTESFDSDGNPTLLVAADSTPATTEQVALIRVQPLSMFFTNSVGSTQENATPHYVDILCENSTITGNAVLNTGNMVKLLAEVDRLYGIQRFYLTAAGVAITSGATTLMTAANLQATVAPEWQAGGIAAS